MEVFAESDWTSTSVVFALGRHVGVSFLPGALPGDSFDRLVAPTNAGGIAREVTINQAIAKINWFFTQILR